MNEQVELVTVWTPAIGWLAFPDYGRGTLLPPYESGTALSEPSQEKRCTSANPMIRVRPHMTGKQRAYDTAQREAIQALRKDGMACREIATRFAMPLRSVFTIVARKEF